jgi:hypothetical protein
MEDCMADKDPFPAWEYTIIRFTLFILLILGSIGVIAFAVKHLVDFIRALL